MNKVLLGASLAVTLLVSACSQGPAEVSGGLGAQFGTARDDAARVVTTDAQWGRVYLAGAYTGPANTRRGEVLFFQRYDRDGRFVWGVSANVEAPNTYVSAGGADVDAAGNVYFGWEKQVDPTGDNAITGFVSKYSPGGRRLFRIELKDRTIRGLGLDSAGGVYIAGRIDNAAGSSEYVRKYTGSGKLMWEKALSYPDISYTNALEVASDGSVYLAGSTVDAELPETDPTLVRLRGSDGRLLWSGAVKGSIGDGLAVDVAASRDAVYAVTSDDSGTNYYLTKLRPDGASVWERRINSDTAVAGLDTDAEGNVYLTGAASTDNGDFFVLKYTPSGSVALSRVFRDPATNAEALDLKVASSSELYVVGSTDGLVNGANYGGRDAFLLRLGGRLGRFWER